MQLAISIMLGASVAAGCGSSGKSQGNLCEKLWANEAKLSCPLGDQAGCVTGCGNVYDDAKTMYPDCAAEIDSVFDCQGNVPVSSIECNPSSSSPIYPAGTCSATENRARHLHGRHRRWSSSDLGRERRSQLPQTVTPR